MCEKVKIYFHYFFNDLSHLFTCSCKGVDAIGSSAIGPQTGRLTNFDLGPPFPPQ